MPRLLEVFSFAAVLMLLIWLSHDWPYHDDTDPPDGHSGLSLYTDHRTGCQYLGVLFGGLTPRLGPDGRQLCVPAP